MVNELTPALALWTLPRKRNYRPKGEGHPPSGSGVLLQLHIDFEGAASSEANRGGRARLFLLRRKKKALGLPLQLAPVGAAHALGVSGREPNPSSESPTGGGPQSPSRLAWSLRVAFEVGLGLGVLLNRAPRVSERPCARSMDSWWLRGWGPRGAGC